MCACPSPLSHLHRLGRRAREKTPPRYCLELIRKSGFRRNELRLCESSVLSLGSIDFSPTSVHLYVKDSSFTRKNSSYAGTGGNSSVFEPDKEGSLQKFANEAESISNRDSSGSLSFDILELKRELEKEEMLVGSSEEEDEDRVLPEVHRKVNLQSEEEEEEERVRRTVRRRVSASGRQILKRSNLLAKQVISMESACSMGFISQLWVDAGSWLVAVVEVRSSILSGENEKFLLEDVCQVGDVVLVQDEGVVENELKMTGLDTLVGYNVVTSGRRSVGKVRGYNFNINSGAIESLELDSFGMSIIPSSLVSTYSLFIEDVLEVVPDMVVVHDDAISRVQRLTKGVWGSQPVASLKDDVEEYANFRRWRRGQGNGNRDHRKKFRNFPSKMRDIDDDWDLPMEY